MRAMLAEVEVYPDDAGAARDAGFRQYAARDDGGLIERLRRAGEPASGQDALDGGR